MKAAPLLVAWHDENAPIYSAHFEPHGKGRLATAGGDNHVRIWKVETNGDERKVTYLSTLKRHTQAVNVVRWCPRGELLATAGDDGNVLVWTPADGSAQTSFGEDAQEDVEFWRVKTMCRSNSGSEIYDLAWSPDGTYFVTGSMDNVATIYNASNGHTVRQIAEHNHYVQGVAWDPLNEFVATQSSDRSVHIYTLKTKDGQFSLDPHNRVTKMDLPGRRISSNSPAPPDLTNHRASFMQDAFADAVGSPRPSAPDTPQSLALPMNPPPTSHSRRSSFGSQAGQSHRRSVSPSPSTMPLPAVMPSASPSLSGGLGPGFRNAPIYANETFTSFFRRLTFTPDGSLLLTPAGQYKTFGPGGDHTKDDTINTVYIYTRAGLNKPPVAYLPGHKKPSIAVRCSPIYYSLRGSSSETKEIAIDTRHPDEDIPSLPGPAMPAKPPTSHSSMDPPPLKSAPSPSPGVASMASPRQPVDSEASTPAPPAGPTPAFSLPYRIIYAVATQDAVHVYDTQQQKPLCVVSNLHYSTFTDLTWSGDGNTLLMTSSDGFCSALTFAPGELGSVHHPPAGTRHTPTPIAVAQANSAAPSPQATPTAAGHEKQPSLTSVPRQASITSNALPGGPSPLPFSTDRQQRPASPARSMSASSMGTESSFARVPDQNAHPGNNPTPQMSAMPPVAAGGMPLFTPPQTPGHHANGSTNSVPGLVPAGMKRESNVSVESAATAASNVAAGVKRESVASGTGEDVEERAKKRRIAPTLVSGGDASAGSTVPTERPGPPSGTGGE
ncbi:Chromatin assembly factor 1 subunit [Saxophila tyrrhenica]|uniref:Chromatin assembly factor 1 subunit n=1 Tax=Saxophila tyrrhenica TaxID=1690608 RepID=A0AAV9PGJ3_9PEZI|nr:Chromatin assembly factor 1 subunit [Saxophila tyrrhenica]